MWLGVARMRRTAVQVLRSAVIATGPVMAHALGVPLSLSCGEGARDVLGQEPVAARFPLARAACGRSEGMRQALPKPLVHGASRAGVQQVVAAMPAVAEAGPVPRPARRLPLRTASADLQRIVALVPVMDEAARRHDIDPLLLHAIAHVESRHRAGAVSRAGARGVMQVMPATARRFGVAQAEALHDAALNVEVGAAYLKRLQHRFGNDLPLVLAAYNAGEGAVARHGWRVPPYRETQDYVRSVLAEYDRLRRAGRQGRPGRVS